MMPFSKVQVTTKLRFKVFRPVFGSEIINNRVCKSQLNKMFFFRLGWVFVIFRDLPVHVIIVFENGG